MGGSMCDAGITGFTVQDRIERMGEYCHESCFKPAWYLQTEIAFWLKTANPSGKVLTECSVQTSKGVKVANVAWGSDGFFATNAMKTPYQVAPEVCVEIVSPSNAKAEIQEKIMLYLAKGAKEVWICDEMGKVKFYSYEGEKATSELFANAPLNFE